MSIRGVGKTFTAGNALVAALEDISVDVAAGEIFMIVGPSGCGKTTLLRIAAGLEAATRGDVQIRHSDRARPQNAMVFQGDSLFPWMTVFDNAAYGLRMRRAPPARIAEVVGHLLDRIGLSRFRDAYPHQLSGGMKQRVSIARAFATDPEVLLMDEPFSALDEQNRTILHEELLRILDETPKTVMFITHSVDEAVTLGDRIMVMTANPGRAKTIIDVPLPRPRNVLQLRAQPAYGALVYQIWGHLEQEVHAARARELGEAE
ncbi:MAG TPA: ABC transporter ATP-binding protein [Polyangia bacterium]|nr:ABC transporter ATP-binding protein [Polyangia bacterium]